MKRFFCSLLTTLLIGSAWATPAAPPENSRDPFVGVWTLIPQKSKYPRGECPRSLEIVMETTGNGIHYRSNTTYADGNSRRVEYTANYDGKEVLVIGSAGLLLPVALQRVDAYTVVARYSRGLRIVATSRRVVSHDGRFMTITTTSPDSSGKSLTSVGVYEKKIRAAQEP